MILVLSINLVDDELDIKINWSKTGSLVGDVNLFIFLDRKQDLIIAEIWSKKNHIFTYFVDIGWNIEIENYFGSKGSTVNHIKGIQIIFSLVGSWNIFTSN